MNEGQVKDVLAKYIGQPLNDSTVEKILADLKGVFKGEVGEGGHLRLALAPAAVQVLTYRVGSMKFFLIYDREVDRGEIIAEFNKSLGDTIKDIEWLVFPYVEAALAVSLDGYQHVQLM